MGPPPARRAGGGKGRTQMSSWIGDWERALIPAARLAPASRERGKYRTQCKLGRHAVLELDPARWVTDATLAPLGLSCVPCIQARAAELGRVLDLTEPAPAPKVPAPRKVRQVPPPEEWVHGDPSTYVNLKCRCVPCRQANAKRSADYRARRRGVLR